MAQNDTVDRILHAATILFSERGFAETSLRTITGMAEVNLAAVNYHFGSKKELIQAVFFRFLKPFCDELEERMDKLEKSKAAGESPSAEELLTCLFDSLLFTTETLQVNPQTFMRLLGLAYTQSQEHLRHYLKASLGATYTRFVALLQKVSPSLDPVSFYWRLYFMLGACVFTVSSFDSIRAILNADYHEDMNLRSAIDMMIPSIALMLNSPDANKQNQN